MDGILVIPPNQRLMYGIENVRSDVIHGDAGASKRKRIGFFTEQWLAEGHLSPRGGPHPAIIVAQAKAHASNRLFWPGFQQAYVQHEQPW